MSRFEESNLTDNEAHEIRPSATQPNKSRAMLRLLLMMSIDLFLPLLLYYILSKFIPDIWALALSGVPPAISVLVNFIIRRQVSVLGILVVLAFIIGIILSVVQGDPRIYLLRESFVTGVFGLVFVITIIPIKIGSFHMRPLLYYNSKNLEVGDLKGLTEDEPIPERYERYWRSYAGFRQTFIVLTAVWGFGLLIEVPVRVFIIYHTATVDQAVYIGSIFLYSWLGCLTLFTFIYSRYMKKKGEEQQKFKDKDFLDF
ncbi:17414_t:CDS:1 [Dentiscutata erythropus]|uniref:17414_t:CDS:1 n=1 Tax=Dentiscutata erythropus TaxID=1348616 RepID=A0A9N9CCV9_9GLOM|nr:17414_t:CDS:1 [Dentiscutata erythropus]